MVDEPEPVLFAAFGSAADEVVAVSVTVPGESWEVMPTLNAAVAFAASDGPLHEALLALKLQVKPPPATLTMLPPVTERLRAGAPESGPPFFTVTVSVKFAPAFTLAGALTERTPKSDAGVTVMVLSALLLAGVGSATLW